MARRVDERESRLLVVGSCRSRLPLCLGTYESLPLLDLSHAFPQPMCLLDLAGPTQSSRTFVTRPQIFFFLLPFVSLPFGAGTPLTSWPLTIRRI